MPYPDWIALAQEMRRKSKRLVELPTTWRTVPPHCLPFLGSIRNLETLPWHLGKFSWQSMAPFGSRFRVNDVGLADDWRDSSQSVKNANIDHHNIMSTLANTTWNLEQDEMPSNITITLKFGPNQAPPNGSGGPGTMTIIDPTNPPPYDTPFVWVETGDGAFLLQLQNQSPSYTTLTTYTGTHANRAGSGWFSNFNVNFSKTKFSMVKSA